MGEVKNIYDSEQELIKKVGIDLQNKWEYIARRMEPLPLGHEPSRKAIMLWHDEAIKRFHEIGFIVEVDVTPSLAGMGPPSVTVVSRTEDHEFDHTKKAWEVQQARKRGGY